MLFIDPGFENMPNTAQWFSVNYKFLNCHALAWDWWELRQFPNGEYSPSISWLIIFVQNQDDS